LYFLNNVGTVKTIGDGLKGLCVIR
jgi:hypothetical protein